MRRWIALAIGVLLVGGIVAVVSLDGGHSRAGGVPNPITWLAAGDSYSSGNGLSHTAGPCLQATPPASKSWPEAAATSNERLDVVACSGAATSGFLTGGGGQFPQWTPALGRFDLVSFTFGGDDVEFAPVIEQCIGLTRFLGGAVPSDPGHSCPANSIVRARIAALGSHYGAFLEAVVSHAVKPGGNILVLGYPDLIEPPTTWSGVAAALGSCDGISRVDADLLRGWADDLNATVANAVSTFDSQPTANRQGVVATFVSVAGAFEPGHNVCGPDAWINGISALSFGSGSFHPTQAGHNAMGTLAGAAISRLRWSVATS
jgi:hypothetical protein